MIIMFGSKVYFSLLTVYVLIEDCLLSGISQIDDITEPLSKCLFSVYLLEYISLDMNVFIYLYKVKSLI